MPGRLGRSLVCKLLSVQEQIHGTTAVLVCDASAVLELLVVVECDVDHC